MVSFQCEACGDVLTKKKLDPHRNQCRGASFTCIDCMVHFQGTQYKSHTSCMTEAQKYEGRLYKEKPVKGSKAKNNNVKKTPNSKHLSVVPRAPYVEDAPDADDRNPNVPPPPAPSPPPATPSASTAVATTKVASSGKPVNVFDFLVAEDTPNASKISLGGTKSQMKMVADAPSVFEPKSLARLDRDPGEDGSIYDVAYEENGFSYGAGPIEKENIPMNSVANRSMEFMTPAPRNRRERKDDSKVLHPTTSDKKRKRGHVEDLDMLAIQSTPYHEDATMMDAPSSIANNPGTPALNHSGLTGGLSRMMNRDVSRSPEYEDYRNGHDPMSPIKRSKRNERDGTDENGLGISIKGRAGRIVSMLGGSAVSASSGSGNERPSKTLVRVRRRSSSDEGHSGAVVVRREQKNPRDRHVPSKSKRKSRGSDSDRSRSPRGNARNQVVIYRQNGQEADSEREKAAQFLSLVTKGPDSERGCSVHKALKRFHRELPSAGGSEDRDERGRGRGRRVDKDRKGEEEKDLWKTLRLKRNERGEVVVFF